MPEALRPSRSRSGLGFESPSHNLSGEKKILKIGLKLAKIEAKMQPVTLYLETKFLACSELGNNHWNNRIVSVIPI